MRLLAVLLMFVCAHSNADNLMIGNSLTSESAYFYDNIRGGDSTPLSSDLISSTKGGYDCGHHLTRSDVSTMTDIPSQQWDSITIQALSTALGDPDAAGECLELMLAAADYTDLIYLFAHHPHEEGRQFLIDNFQNDPALMSAAIELWYQSLKSSFEAVNGTQVEIVYVGREFLQARADNPSISLWNSDHKHASGNSGTGALITGGIFYQLFSNEEVDESNTYKQSSGYYGPARDALIAIEGVYSVLQSNVIPSNQPPTLSLSHSIDNLTLDLAITVSDPENDLLTCVVDWGDSNTLQIDSCDSRTISHTYQNYGNQTFSVSANDGENETIDSISINVLNPVCY